MKKNLKSWLQDNEIKQFAKTLTKDYEEILQEFSYYENNFHNNFSIENIKKIITDRIYSGLSLKHTSQHSYLQLQTVKDKKTNSWEKLIFFMPQYKGILWKARNSGYNIQCDYIIKKEIDDNNFIFDEKNLNFNINKKHRCFFPVASIPMMKYCKQDTIKDEIINYQWKDYDICGFYIVNRILKTNKIIDIKLYSLHEIIERALSMESKFSEEECSINGEMKKKYSGKEKSYKSCILQDYFDGKDMRVTDAIEILKIRALRLFCKTQGEKLQEITDIIDISDGYVKNPLDNTSDSINLEFEAIKEKIIDCEDLVKLNIIVDEVKKTNFNNEEIKQLRLIFNNKKNFLKENKIS